MNEILLLLSLPALDTFFRDRVTGKPSKHLTFIVDNGPAEQPSSSLVQMCLVRLLRVLKLDKIIVIFLMFLKRFFLYPLTAIRTVKSLRSSVPSGCRSSPLSSFPFLCIMTVGCS